MQRVLNWFRQRSGAPIALSRRPSGIRLSLEEFEERVVPSLTQVAADAGWPWTSICKVNIWYPDGTFAVGSGSMVDQEHVLTAGHVVYDSQHGGWASNIEIVPEMAGSNEPFGDAWMTYERTYDTWINYDNANPGQTGPGAMDIGLLTLDRNIGYNTGWMPFGYNDDNNTFASGTILNTAGYPAAGGYDGQYMYWSGGAIAGLSDDGSVIQYQQSNITTYGGQSGSPVWAYYPDSGTRIIYGVHVGGTGQDDSLNIATRITGQIFNDFVNAMNSDDGPAFSPGAAGMALPGHSPIGNTAAAGQDLGGTLLAGLRAGGLDSNPLNSRDAVFASGQLGDVQASTFIGGQDGSALAPRLAPGFQTGPADATKLASRLDGNTTAENTARFTDGLTGNLVQTGLVDPVAGVRF
jgi:V8-like Glu-specific endopeptidase